MRCYSIDNRLFHSGIMANIRWLHTEPIKSLGIYRRMLHFLSAHKILIKCRLHFSLPSQIPHAEYFSGPKKTANILYRCPRGSGNVTLNDAYARSTVLTAVEPSDSCHVWMKLCNEPGLCSSISNMCLSTPSIFKGV